MINKNVDINIKNNESRNDIAFEIKGNLDASICLIQISGDYDINQVDEEIKIIDELVINYRTEKEATSVSKEDGYAFVTIYIKDPYKQLSPWKIENIFNKNAEDEFGEGATDTLKYIIDVILPTIKDKMNNPSFVIGGYSLAGLFSLWAAYNCDAFCGVMAASPSVWFPGFTQYIKENELKTKYLYLSLGDKEERTKNKVMREVANNIKVIWEEISMKKGIEYKEFEWNQGGHFIDVTLRKAKGYAKIVNAINTIND